MLKSILSFCCLLLSLQLLSQNCPEILSIEILPDGTSDITIESNGWPQVSIPGGIIDPTGGGIVTENRSTLSFFSGPFMIIGLNFGNGTSCAPTMYQFDSDLVYLPNDIDISDESGCGNCDGSVCLSVDGNPILSP